MGNKLDIFTEEQLQDYQEPGLHISHKEGDIKTAVTGCFFVALSSSIESLMEVSPRTMKIQPVTMISTERVQKKFRNLAVDIMPKTMADNNEAAMIRLPVDTIVKLPELKENPFKRRICEVFSKDGTGNLTFEEFLDMLSVFSEQSPRDIKVFYAFKVYDFDNDDHIGSEDMCTTLKILTLNELSAEEMNQVCSKAIEEADVDGDGKLSYMEFNHVILRSPEFFSTFHIRI